MEHLKKTQKKPYKYEFSMINNHNHDNGRIGNDDI